MYILSRAIFAYGGKEGQSEANKYIKIFQQALVEDFGNPKRDGKYLRT